MPLYIFESFCLVAENKSISKAAKLLHASQPTIGAQIKSLEEKYETRLFNRSNQGVELTNAGEIVYKHAKKLLHLHQQLENEIALTKSSKDNCIKIGADKTVGNYVLPYLLSKFKQIQPTVSTEMKIMEHDEICEKVLNKQIHIGIIDGPIECCTLPEHMISGQIRDDKIHLVASPSLKKINNPMTIDEFLRIPLIIPSKELKIREVVEQYFQEELNISIDELNVVCELNSITAMKSYVFAGYGAAFFCYTSISRDLLPNGLQVYNIEGLDMSMTYCFVYHQNCDSEMLKHLVKFLDKNEKRKPTIQKLGLCNCKTS